MTEWIVKRQLVVLRVVPINDQHTHARTISAVNIPEIDTLSRILMRYAFSVWSRFIAGR